MSIILPTEKKKDKKEIHYTLVNSKSLLLIFTRNPELGKCKTRLAATIGDTAALEIYKFLLRHTAKITKNLDVAKEVYYSDAIRADDIWESTIYTKNVQHGADLGERMYNAFLNGFESGFKKIIVIGSDLYDLSLEDLESAFTALDDSDFVVGPAIDGGYYLLGMREIMPHLFKDKEWGEQTVYRDTLDNLKNKKVKLLETKNDVDVYEDIKDIKIFQPYIKHLRND